MTRRSLLGILFFVLILFGLFPQALAVREQSYTLAVIPAAPPVASYSLWTPFVERISHQTGIDLRLKVYERMADFERDISRGAPDFIFANPFQTAVAHRAHGYRPLVRSAKPVAVVVFVLKGSPIKSIDDLSRMKVAFIGNKNL